MAHAGRRAAAGFGFATAAMLTFGTGEGLTARVLQLTALITILSLAPAILVMCTSFTRIIIVLALLRQALGTQALPPSQVLVGLALFMTFLVMAPTFDRINREAIIPMQSGQINQIEAWEAAKQPLRDFMFDQIEYAGNWDSVYMILSYRGVDTSVPERLTRADVDMLTLVPAFILSEHEDRVSHGLSPVFAVPH
ncbi:hypothetical protein HC891_06150, partial [Candidatus Gracilibacteria bacterium]|nr:hypothetical protein [Candidatus Gracilibacteria bacterium]